MDGAQGGGVAPHIGAHHLIVDGVLEQRRLWLASQHVIHELQFQFLGIDLRYRIDGVVAQLVWLLARVRADVIVGTDDQVVLGIAAMRKMLLQVAER
jgi:hypothetical protein